MNEIKPVAVISTEAKEAGHYFTPCQLVRFERIYGRSSASSYRLNLYSERDVKALEHRIAVLELALGGLLHDFDDGVNGGCEHRLRSLDYARVICPAVKFKRKAAKALGK